MPKGKRVSAKISKLRSEGVPQDQAVATALNMERSGRLGPRGGYEPVRRGQRRKRQGRHGSGRADA